MQEIHSIFQHGNRTTRNWNFSASRVGSTRPQATEPSIENRIQEELNSYWTLFEVITLEEFPDFVIGDSDE